MNPDQIAEYKALKAKAEIQKARNQKTYITVNAKRAFFQEYFEKHATAADRKALENKISSL